MERKGIADETIDPAKAATGKTAIFYRTALPDRLCPAEQKACWLPEDKGFEVNYRLFRERSRIDAFKQEYDAPTTPHRRVIHLFAVAADTAL